MENSLSHIIESQYGHPSIIYKDIWFLFKRLPQDEQTIELLASMIYVELERLYKDNVINNESAAISLFYSKQILKKDWKKLSNENKKICGSCKGEWNDKYNLLNIYKDISYNQVKFPPVLFNGQVL